MKLPENAAALAASFPDLNEARKSEILAHLEASGGERAQSTVAQIIKNGGVEGRFVSHIYGKDVPDRGAAPDNKKVNPPNVKNISSVPHHN